MKPALSIICPVFNTRPEHLMAALDSVVIQAADTHVEILVVDDASTQTDTVAVLKALAARRDIRVILLPNNVGPSVARRKGIEQAQSDWIAFLDSDDLWPDGSLAHRLALIRSHPEVRWFGGVTRVLRHHGLAPSEQPQLPDESRLQADGWRHLAQAELTPWLIANTRFVLGGQCIRADLLRDVNAFSKQLTYGEDWITFVELSTQAAMVYSGAHLYTLRRQHESLMSSPKKRGPAYAESIHVALRDPRLKPWKKQLRWALYSRLKGIAADNLAHGERWQALRFGVQALWTLPSGANEFVRLLSLLSTRSLTVNEIRRYSSAEISEIKRASNA